MEGTRDQQNSSKSTRLSERRKLEVEEEARKMEQERKRAKTMFQRKSKVIGPHDMIVDTSVGKINLGAEYASEDVKVKVELNDLKEASDSFGFSKGQGEVIVTQEVNFKEEEAGEMEGEDEDNGHSIGGEFRDVGAERTGSESLTAMVEQLKKEMKQRLEEQDQKITQLTADLEAAKAEVVSVKDKINELQETVTQLQLQLSSTKDGQEATASREGLASTNNQLPGQVPQGHLLDLQENPDQDGSDDVTMLLHEPIDNRGPPVEYPDVFESLLEKKLRNERINPQAPLFEAVLNILVERKRTIAGKLNWSSVCGVMKKCRLVCRSWKASVDNVMQTHPSHLEFRSTSDFRIFGNKHHAAPCPLYLSTLKKSLSVRLPLDIIPSEMGQFIMNLPSTNADSNYNPVPTRLLSVRTSRSRWPWPGWPKTAAEQTGNVYHLTEYLRVFGHQIWYLRLGLGDGIPGKDFDDVYSSVSEILHLVPNLKLLSLKLDHDVSVAKRIHLSESEMEHQFPHLKDLVVVECLQENPLIVQILKANSHVRSLAFHRLWYRDSTGILKLDLPNLSELCISYNDQINMDLFRKANVTWKIRKLTLQLRLSHPLSLPCVESLIDGLTIFGDTLEDLKLDLGYYDGRLGGMQLRLPRLQRLHVQTQQWDEIDWDVLLVECKLLETLELVMEVEKLAIIDLFHEEQDWLTMPQLESVTLIAKKRFRNSNVDREGRKTFKLKRDGMPPLKFIYIKMKV